MTAATILWFRRDLRLADNPAVDAAIARGGPVVPVFVADPTFSSEGGAAARWRLSRSLDSLASDLTAIGGALVFREGDAAETLIELARATGADAVAWSRLYAPAERRRDAATASALRATGLAVVETGGRLIREPEELATQSGGCYRVYTPFWRAFRAAAPPSPPSPPPSKWPSPTAWPTSASLADLGLERGMNRGAAVVAKRVEAGERAALRRLRAFLSDAAAAYATDRDRLDRNGTSGLSHHLAVGEISPRTAWVEAEAVAAEAGPSAFAGFETFLKELVWREFAHHLLAHAPQMIERNWRAEWDAFPWLDESEAGEAVDRWRRGLTGVDVIDAAMRELYVRGLMHNRARMLTASFLTKHLLVDWRVGEAWFRDCLIDWDAASNAMGWQWVAGAGPDAAPFFRIFNPETQAQKFDPKGAYVARWLGGGGSCGDLFDAQDDRSDADAFYDACPRSWRLSPDDPRPEPIVSLSAGRARALAAYEGMRAAAS